MERYKSFRAYSYRSSLAVFLSGLLVFSAAGDLNGQWTPNLYNRAPDVIPETLPEMRTESYWISRMENPSEVVMTPQEIRAMNRAYQQRIGVMADRDDDSGQRIRQQLGNSPGIYANRPDLSAKSPAERSGVVRDLIERQIQLLTRRPYGNILGIQYADHEIESLEEEMALGSVPDRIDPQPGITVADTRVRIVPALRDEYVGLTQVGKTRWDVWNLDLLPVASPVQILHVSASGGHLLVFSDYGYGWVRSETVAIASQQEIDRFVNAEDFVISLSDRVPLFSDENSLYVSGWLRMGARLPVAASGNERVVQVPVRQMNGRLAVQEAWLAPDAEVNRGLFPYTRENVIQLGFTMLDYIYDWTGAWYGRNDGTVLRDMFRTFGFDIPANGVLLSMFTEGNWVSHTEDGSKEERYREMITASPFTTFMTSRSGHSLLYLGDFNGVPVVFDTHGYGYEDEEGREIEIRRWNIATLSMPDYLLNQNVTVTPIY